MREALTQVELAPYFEDQVRIQLDAIASFKKWMAFLVATGFLVALIALLFKNALQLASQILGIGGLFIGALATFPYREITPRRERIKTCDWYASVFRGFEKYSKQDQEYYRDKAIDYMQSHF